jgi:hypothetical protein
VIRIMFFRWDLNLTPITTLYLQPEHWVDITTLESIHKIFPIASEIIKQNGRRVNPKKFRGGIDKMRGIVYYIR